MCKPPVLEGGSYLAYFCKVSCRIIVGALSREYLCRQSTESDFLPPFSVIEIETIYSALQTENVLINYTKQLRD